MASKFALQLEFKTQAGKDFNLRVNDVKKDLDTTTVAGVMDALITDKLFGPTDIVVDKTAANLIETKISNLL